MINLDYLLLFILVFLSFFFSGSETSFFSLSKIKIENIKIKHPKRAKLIEYLLSNPQRLLVTILICNVFVNIFATMTASKIFSKISSGNEVLLSTLVMTPVILIFGEVIPKTLAIKAAPSIAKLVAPIFYILAFILTPFIFFFRKVATFLVFINSKLFYRNASENKIYHSKEMLEVIKDSEKNGIIDKTEGSILGNIINFAGKDVAKICRPRQEMVTINIEESIQDIITFLKEKKYSRIPVWKKDEENIIGILYTKQLLKFDNSTRTLKSFKSSLKKPFFIPETMHAEKLLKEFQATNNHIAVVIDEFGSISGLITLEDVLEEIIGEVVDKDDIRPLYHLYSPKMIEIESKMEITEFNKVFKTSLKTKNNITVGGFVLENIHKIPEVGELFIINNLRFKISKSQPNKIETMLISKIQKSLLKKGANKK